MNIRDYHIVYFIGIGGIGMSALARWFQHYGYTVSGYDRTSTILTQSLEMEGIGIHYVDSVTNIPNNVLESKGDTLVIYTPAISDDHREYNYLLENGYKVIKRSEALGLLTREYFTIAVAGTHGKTTTCCMIAHILKKANRKMAAFLGGIAVNYGSNLIINGDQEGDLIAIVEADEYDRSFLRLDPDIAVVTSMEADHLDIYGDKENLKDSFKAFVDRLKEDGLLVINEKIANELDPAIPFENYGLKSGSLTIRNKRIKDGACHFDVTGHGFELRDLELFMPGNHNIENILAAILVARSLSIPDNFIYEGVRSFRGVKRRFEFVIRTDKIILIDDYAHHPSEITAFLEAVKELYPEKRITAVFQPHLYSRTRDFAPGFGQSLSLASEVIVLDIYPAREKPIPGVTEQIVFDNIPIEDKVMCRKEELIGILENRDLEVVTMIGAGDIDQLVEPVRQSLEERFQI